MVPDDRARTVFKIVPVALWRGSEPSGLFAGSPVDMRDGFLHFSTASQLPQTAARHFTDVDAGLQEAGGRIAYAHVRPALEEPLQIRTTVSLG